MRAVRGAFKGTEQEAASLVERGAAIPLAQRVVVKAAEDPLLFHGGSQTTEKAELRPPPHNPVGTGDQKQRWRMNRGCIFDDSCRSGIEAEQKTDRNRPRDQRVGGIRRGAFRVVGKSGGLYVG